jgi:hypothetical protein
MTANRQQPRPEGPARDTDPRPAYEPPRLTKKRSVSRATLFSGAGAAVQGVVTEGPPG